MNGIKFWRFNSGVIDISDSPIFMGIVNVTPDSFSDGGKYFEITAAISRGLELAESGAGIIDVGGESTRPGSDLITVEEELRRVVDVIAGIRKINKNIPISIDTNKTITAKESIKAGANIINDVFSAEDDGMIQLIRETGAAICIMHRQGNPKTMQDNPIYNDVVSEVWNYLKQRRIELIKNGINSECIAIDPGLGFGKTAEHNWQLVENIERFTEIESPLLVGHSRKRFLATKFADREEGTKFVTKQLIKKGVNIIRIHEMHKEYNLRWQKNN
ncbi:MAG: dihydropteroate synthase [Planctomycetaceae bacterium]|nr:dihydropteroate synthase [Planctomycetaceae bacterium]